MGELFSLEHFEWDTINTSIREYIQQFNYESSQLIVAWFDPDKHIYKSSSERYTLFINNSETAMKTYPITELFSLHLCRALLDLNELPRNFDNYAKVYDWYKISIHKSVVAHSCRNIGYNMSKRSIESLTTTVDTHILKQFNILRKHIYSSAVNECVSNLVSNNSLYCIVNEYLGDARVAGYAISDHPHWDNVRSLIANEIFSSIDNGFQHLYEDYYIKNNPEPLTYIATMIANNADVEEDYTNGVFPDVSEIIEIYLNSIR